MNEFGEGELVLLSQSLSLNTVSSANLVDIVIEKVIVCGGGETVFSICCCSYHMCILYSYIQKKRCVSPHYIVL